MPYPTDSPAIEASIVALATTFPTLCTRTAFTNPTNPVGGPARTYSFLKIGHGSNPNRPAALIVAGMHAREWAQPDAALTFAGNLLSAYSTSSAFTIPSFTDSSGTVHGPVVVSASTVRAIIDHMDIYMVPNANPDGRAFSITAGNNMWRKNRASAPAGQIGIDLNRNFAIAFDFDVYYSAAAAADPNFTNYTSKTSSTDVYIGTAPFSERETQNIKFLLDNFPISYYIDLHSFGQKVMHPWGIETIGTNPLQNFDNASFDHLRDGNLGTTYEEFFPNTSPLRLLDKHRTMVNSMRDSIRAATGEVYSAEASIGLYPCTGTSDDYAFSRQFRPATPRTIYAFSAEFGNSTDYYAPAVARYPKIEREIHAALVAFVKQIAIWQGLIPSTTTPPPPSSSPCPIVIALASASLGFIDHADVLFLRAFRDRLKESPLFGAGIRGFEKLYYRISPRIARHLSLHGTSRQLARSLIIPFVAAMRMMFPRIDADAK